MTSIHAEVAILYRYITDNYPRKWLVYFHNMIVNYHLGLKRNKKNCIREEKYKFNIKHDLIVVRFSNNSERYLMNSKPCYNCIQILRKIGIKRCTYSDNSGNLITEKVKCMHNSHVSHGIRGILAMNADVVFGNNASSIC